MVDVLLSEQPSQPPVPAVHPGEHSVARAAELVGDLCRSLSRKIHQDDR
jgi:hypothetical protein